MLGKLLPNIYLHLFLNLVISHVYLMQHGFKILIYNCFFYLTKELLFPF